jgi:hypothetical protein
MIFEVGKSIEVAYELSPLLESYGFNVEIHADINPNPKHDSNKALQQAVGYILGMGYDFKIKPEAPVQIVRMGSVKKISKYNNKLKGFNINIDIYIKTFYIDSKISNLPSEFNTFNYLSDT